MLPNLLFLGLVKERMSQRRKEGPVASGREGREIEREKAWEICQKDSHSSHPSPSLQMAVRCAILSHTLNNTPKGCPAVIMAVTLSWIVFRTSQKPLVCCLPNQAHNHRLCMSLVNRELLLNRIVLFFNLQTRYVLYKHLLWKWIVEPRRKVNFEIYQKGILVPDTHVGKQIWI